MKSRSLLWLAAASLSLALLPQAALADTLTVTAPTVGTAGGTVPVYGTYTNTGSTLENLLGDSYTVAIPGSSLDDSPYFNGALSVAAGQAVTEELFTLTLPSGLTLGSYGAYFTINTDGASATAGYNVNVTNPAAVTPEPSTWLLLATGLLGTGLLLRRRNQLAAASTMA